MNTPEPKRTAIYLRKSMVTEDSISYAVQEAESRRLAEREGWDVVDVYPEREGSSASKGGKGNAANRPELVKLRAAYERKEFDFALVHHSSRLSRNMSDGAEIVADMLFASVLDNVRYTEPGDDDFYPLLNMLLNHKFAKEMSKRWSETHTYRFNEGLPPTGGHPYGYDHVIERTEPVGGKAGKKISEAYVPNADAEKLVEAYRRFINGAGFRVVADVLGVDTRVARRTLDSGFGAGMFLWQKSHWAGAHRAVISHGEWIAYLRERERRATLSVQARSHTKKRPMYWLAGCVRCGRCSGSMVRNDRHMRCMAYVSRGKAVCPGVWAKIPDVEHAVTMWLGAHVEEWSAGMPAYEGEQQIAERAILDATADRDSAKAALDLAVGQVLRGLVTDAEAAPVLTELREALKAAQSLVDTAEAQAAMARPSDDWSRILRGGEDLEPEEWNATLRRTLRVVVMPGEISVHAA